MTINTQKLRAFRQSLQRCASNTGHGHVYMRPDGFLAKCGGPGICTECAKDLALLMAHDGYEPPTTDDLIDTIDAQAAEIARLREALRRLAKRFEVARDGAEDWFHETGNVYHQGRLVAYDQAAADVRAALQEKSND